MKRDTGWRRMKQKLSGGIVWRLNREWSRRKRSWRIWSSALRGGNVIGSKTPGAALIKNERRPRRFVKPAQREHKALFRTDEF